MPEFVMPPDTPAREPAAPELPEPASGPAAQHREHTDEPAEPIARRGLPWRHLTAAMLLGILIGAGVPSVVQGIDRAAADARVEGLRSTAMAYLEAIAAGESDAATGMVPLEEGAETPPDSVLLSAQRIELPEVWLTEVEGDLATVEVRYRVTGRVIARSLDAEHVDGRWRLLTSLAEPVVAYSFDGSLGITVAGVELPPSDPALPPSPGVLLYPGRYETDRTTTPLIAAGGERLDVDGDPTTPTEIFSAMELAPGIADVAEQVGIAHVLACGSGGECAIEASADVTTVEVPWVESIDRRTGAVTMVLQLHSREFAGQMHQLRMRATVDEAGAQVEWECSELSEPSSVMEPCRA